MKTIRTFVFAGAVALLTVASSTPAHATLSGSNPRPEVVVISIYFSAALTLLGL